MKDSHPEEFISTTEVLELLNVSLPAWKEIKIKENLSNYAITNFQGQSSYIYYPKWKINEIILKQNNLLSCYYSYSDLKKYEQELPGYFFVDSFIRLHKTEIRRISKRDAVIMNKENYSLTFYHKEDVDKLVNEIRFFVRDLSQGLYLTVDETKAELGITKIGTYNALLREEKLANFQMKKGVYFYFMKDVILDLKIKQGEILCDFYTRSQVIEMIGEDIGKKVLRKFSNELKPYPIPALVRDLLDESKIVNFYKKNDVNNFINSKLEYIENLRSNQRPAEFYEQTVSNDPSLSYKHKVDLLGLKFSNKSSGTEAAWTSWLYSEIKTKSKNKSEHALDTYINQAVYATQNLVKFCEIREIFEMTSHEINWFLDQIPIQHAKVIYKFLRRLHSLIHLETGKSVYRISEIRHPDNRSKSYTENKEIYSLEEYQQYHWYANDVELHMKKSILDLKNTPQLRTQYDSAWLSFLVFLCNAWRPSDVVKFPRINLRDTPLDGLSLAEGLSWFEKNNLSFEEAKTILDRIVHFRNLVVSKTNVKNFFFYSDDLAISMATAAALCELRTQSEFPFAESIINIRTKSNRFSNAYYKNFLSEMKDKIKFGPLKMNRTLITFMDILATKNGDSAISLSLAQSFRRHVDEESTNIYVHIPQEEIDWLSSQLFQRGPFGYVANLLAELLTGRSENAQSTLAPLVNRVHRSMLKIEREQRTNEILNIYEKFGDIYKIQATSGFLAQIQNDELAINEYLISKNFEELSELMFRIHTEQLPSKEMNIQCLFSVSGCKKIGTNTKCIECVYAIPNYYALSALAASIIEVLHEFQKNMDQEIHYAEKARLANLLYIRNKRLKEACNQFGVKDVFRFLGMSFDEFKNIVSEIDSITEYRTLEIN